MTPVPPTRRLAADLLAAEVEPDGTGGPAEGLHDLLRRLHTLLQPLIGSAGYQMVLARGALRGSRDHEALGHIDVESTGPPAETSIQRALADAEQPEEAALTLVESTIGFLADFLGWRLTLRMLRREWPEVAAGHDAGTLDEYAFRARERKEEA